MIALAWRNLWRAPGRSLTTAGVVALATYVGLLTFVLTWALINGIFQTATERTGHLVVRVAGYEQAALEARYFPQAVEARVRKRVKNAVVEGVLSHPALVAGGRRGLGAVVFGFEPGGRNDRVLVQKHLVAGQGLRPGGAVMGRALARRAGLAPGDAAYLFAPGALGMGSGLLPVLGLVDLPESRLEANFVATDLATAQALFAPGLLERVEVTLPWVRRYAEAERIRALQEALAQALGSGYQVLRWDQAYRGMGTLLVAYRRWLYLFVLLFFVLAALMVLNAVYLSFYERIRELGVIAALGATPAQLGRLVWTEATLLSALGAAAGTLLGLATAWRLARGFPMIAAEEYAQFGIPKVLYGELHAGDLGFTLLVAFLSSWLAALLPAYLAMRLEPVEAMRHAGD